MLWNADYFDHSFYHNLLILNGDYWSWFKVYQGSSFFWDTVYIVSDKHETLQQIKSFTILYLYITKHTLTEKMKK